MKRFIGVLLVILVLSSCKKGENDPVFSIKPRKARLTGTWVANSGSWIQENVTYNFDGSEMVVSDTNNIIDSYDFAITMTFDNSGGYSYLTSKTFSENSTDTSLVGITCEQIENGLWNFTGGAGNTKLKSQLLLLPSKYESSCSNSPANVNTTSIDGQNEGLVYNIVRLTDKELVLMYNIEIATATGTVVRSAEIELSKSEN